MMWQRIGVAHVMLLQLYFRCRSLLAQRYAVRCSSARPSTSRCLQALPLRWCASNSLSTRVRPYGLRSTIAIKVWSLWLLVRLRTKAATYGLPILIEPLRLRRAVMIPHLPSVIHGSSTGLLIGKRRLWPSHLRALIVQLISLLLRRPSCTAELIIRSLLARYAEHKALGDAACLVLCDPLISWQ